MGLTGLMRWAFAATVVLHGMVGRAEVPVVVFDVPLTTECREVTPKGFREAYHREIIEAVFKISPQLLTGDEKDLTRLHYEISTEQQMPVVHFLPNAEVSTDVVNGTIAIQSSSHHGEISFRYLILPGKGDGQLKGDLESSQAQFSLLAPKQLLIAAGTIERGCGVYFELRKSTQDTLQKQREFACLFEVPAGWRADAVLVRCKAKGMKRGLAGLLDSEVPCGSGLLSVGLYKRDDGEARQYARLFAKKQQAYLDKLAQQSKPQRPLGLPVSAATWDRLLSEGSKRAGGPPTTVIGAAIRSQIEENSLALALPRSRSGGVINKALVDLGEPEAPRDASSTTQKSLLAGNDGETPEETKAAFDEMQDAKNTLRKMNGRK
jgi:hypothetical protein